MDRLMGCRQELNSLPVIGLCGSSGAGKTTLIEALIPKFTDRGIRVAVVKHGAHRVRVDAPGKDSDRFFQAGADVALFGEEHFFRRHDSQRFFPFLRSLCLDYDLILVEGHATTQVPKIWLLGRGHTVPPENAENIQHVLHPEERRTEAVFEWISEWLNHRCQSVPLYGCLLIGGKSRRMGRPKHMIQEGKTTWIERAVVKLEPHVQQVVLSGSGEIPSSLAHLPRLPDVPGLAGPMAGLLAALRWQPMASWIVAACDQPDIDPQAFVWLKTQRSPGVRAVMPDLHGEGYIEPLLAWYDYRCLHPVEDLAARDCLRLSRLVGQAGVITPQPPTFLHGSWRNVNTPAELVREVHSSDKRS